MQILYFVPIEDVLGAFLLRLHFAKNRYCYYTYLLTNLFYPSDFDVHSKDYAKSHIRIFTQDEHQRTFIWAEIEWLKKKNRGKEY